MVELVDREGGRPLGTRNPDVGGGIRGPGRAWPLRNSAAVLPRGARIDRWVCHPNGGVDSVTSFDHTVDVLVVGSGAGGMTAALAADASGLDTLVIEKSPQFGGSNALSGGG